jgi:hypothetical protein
VTFLFHSIKIFSRAKGTTKGFSTNNKNHKTKKTTTTTNTTLDIQNQNPLCTNILTFKHCRIPSKEEIYVHRMGEYRSLELINNLDITSTGKLKITAQNKYCLWKEFVNHCKYDYKYRKYKSRKLRISRTNNVAYVTNG